MTLPKLFVKRPVAVLMCVLMLVVFGISSIFGMEMESTPEMSMPVFMVMTRYEEPPRRRLTTLSPMLWNRPYPRSATLKL